MEPKGIAPSLSWLAVYCSALVTAAVFTSCTFFGKKDPRRLPEAKVSAAQNYDPSSSSPFTLDAGPPAFPLEADQISRTLEQQLGHTVPEHLIASVRFEAESKLLPPDQFLVEPSLWKQRLEFAEAVAEQLAHSPAVDATLGSCASSGECYLRAIENFAPLLMSIPAQPALDSERAAAFETGNDLRSAVKLALTHLLSSPRFWSYVPSSATPGDSALSHRSVLWFLNLKIRRSAPTAEMFARAGGGLERPLDRAQLNELLNQILSATDSVAGWMRFVSKWIVLGLLRSLSKDPLLFPKWGPQMAEGFQDEILVNAERIYQQELPAARLLFDENWQLPPRTAELYGTDVHRERRNGILTSGAFAALTSDAVAAKPTARGHLVLSTFLCQEISAPPEGVGVLASTASETAKSIRERLLVHTQAPACASCHQLMDPLGFVFEELSPVGSFRSDYGAEITAGYQMSPLPLDTRVILQLPGSTDSIEIDAVDKLARELSGLERVSQCAATKLGSYLGLSAEMLNQTSGFLNWAAEKPSARQSLKTLLLAMKALHAPQSDTASPPANPGEAK